jgi:hypothetical protein
MRYLGFVESGNLNSSQSVDELVYGIDVGTAMDDMVPFRFVEFFDVPRTIVVRYRKLLFLLQTAFDHELDKYPENYSVYLLPDPS